MTVEPLCGEPVLRQVTDGERVGSHDGAAVGFVEPGEHPQQRGLAGAIRAAQADAIAIADLPRHLIEQDPLAEGLCEGLQLNHAGSQLPVVSCQFKEASMPIPATEPFELETGN